MDVPTGGLSTGATIVVMIIFFVVILVIGIPLGNWLRSRLKIETLTRSHDPKQRIKAIMICTVLAIIMVLLNKFFWTR